MLHHFELFLGLPRTVSSPLCRVMVPDSDQRDRLLPDLVAPSRASPAPVLVAPGRPDTGRRRARPVQESRAGPVGMSPEPGPGRVPVCVLSSHGPAVGIFLMIRPSSQDAAHEEDMT